MPVGPQWREASVQSGGRRSPGGENRHGAAGGPEATEARGWLGSGPAPRARASIRNRSQGGGEAVRT